MGYRYTKDVDVFCSLSMVMNCPDSSEDNIALNALQKNVCPNSFEHDKSKQKVLVKQERDLNVKQK